MSTLVIIAVFLMGTKEGWDGRRQPSRCWASFHGPQSPLLLLLLSWSLLSPNPWTGGHKQPFVSWPCCSGKHSLATSIPVKEKNTGEDTTLGRNSGAEHCGGAWGSTQLGSLPYTSPVATLPVQCSSVHQPLSALPTDQESSCHFLGPDFDEVSCLLKAPTLLS
jgi:hypothetical protein